MNELQTIKDCLSILVFAFMLLMLQDINERAKRKWKAFKDEFWKQYNDLK